LPSPAKRPSMIGACISAAGVIVPSNFSGGTLELLAGCEDDNIAIL
jgi:hypothetical protein